MLLLDTDSAEPSSVAEDEVGVDAGELLALEDELTVEVLVLVLLLLLVEGT